MLQREAWRVLVPQRYDQYLSYANILQENYEKSTITLSLSVSFSTTNIPAKATLRRADKPPQHK